MNCASCNKKLHGNSKTEFCRVCNGEYEIQQAIEAHREKQIFLNEYELTNDRFLLLNISDISEKELRKTWRDFHGRNKKIRILHLYHRCYKKNLERSKRGRKRNG